MAIVLACVGVANANFHNRPKFIVKMQQFYGNFPIQNWADHATALIFPMNHIGCKMEVADY